MESEEQGTFGLRKWMRVHSKDDLKREVVRQIRNERKEEKMNREKRERNIQE